MKRILFAITASLLAAVAAHAADAPASRIESATNVSLRTVLAPTGTLRAAFLGANPVQGRVDPVTGAVTGPVADLVQELAMRIGVPFRIVASPDARTVIAHLQDQSADIGFLAYEASRAAEVDFAGPYAVMLNSYVVANQSPLKQSADADSAGLTIGAVKGQAQELYVSNQLKNARVRVFDRQPPQQEMEALFANGDLSAFAMNRQRALELDRASAGLRALPDSFLEVVQQFVVAKGATARREILDRFARDVRGSGFVKESLKKAGLEDSARVASDAAP